MDYKKIFSPLNISVFFNAFVLIAVGLLLVMFMLSHTEVGISSEDQKFMDMAYDEAGLAQADASFPVGAIVVADGRVVARAHNLVGTSTDARDHAEMIAINEALKILKVDDFSQYGGNVVLYTTYEPCPMCEGFIIWKKVDRVIVGKRKGIRELFNDNITSRINYRFNMRSGLSEFKHDQLTNNINY